MGLFDLFRGKDIDSGVEQYRNTKGAVLLDVRTPAEYSEGHIPSAVNLPLQNIEEAERLLPDKAVPVYVYCYSGARSSQASAQLKRMAYSDVVNIGGISAYSGPREI